MKVLMLLLALSLPAGSQARFFRIPGTSPCEQQAGNQAFVVAASYCSQIGCSGSEFQSIYAIAYLAYSAQCRVK